MTPKQKLLLTTFLLLILSAAFLVFIPDHTNCRSPLIPPSRQRAEAIITRVVIRLGGLPKSAMDLDAEASTAAIYPIDDWEIEAVTVGNTRTLLQSLGDDDPTYGYTIDLRVSYADGSQQRLRWSSWRYGLVVCPVLVLPGDGPPGEIMVLE